MWNRSGGAGVMVKTYRYNKWTHIGTLSVPRAVRNMMERDIERMGQAGWVPVSTVPSQRDRVWTVTYQRAY